MATVFKFISLPNQLLATVGIGNHHMHMLQNELGINYFPPETLAIGTGLVEDDGRIDNISFDFGDQGGKQHAMDQLQGWALENGYTLGEHIHSIYKNAADSWIKQKIPHEIGSGIAFAWLEGKLYLGSSHPSIMDGLAPNYEDESLWLEGNHIFGYFYPPNSVDIFSDFYDEEYDPATLQACLKALHEKWPNITEITYGPDEETLGQMRKYLDNDSQFDDPRQARLAFIDKILSS